MLGRGATRVFRGPGRFSPADPVRRGPRGEVRRPTGARLGGIMMSSIDRPRPTPRPRTGAARPAIGAIGGSIAPSPAPTPAELPTIWDVDPAWTGAVCVRADRMTRLAQTDGSAPVEIAAADGTSRRVSWEAGSRFAAWPGDLPIIDGAAFYISGEGAAAPRRILVRLLRDLPEAVASGDPVALADVFIAQGCTAQLERLVAATLVDEVD